MPFKQRTNLEGTNNLNANSLRQTLRHAGLHNENDPKKQALFETIDTLLLELARTADLAKTNQTEIVNVTVTGGAVPTTRAINTTTPLTGGGDLSADRTIAISATPEFTREGLGTPADASAVLKALGQIFSVLKDDGNSGTAKTIN